MVQVKKVAMAAGTFSVALGIGFVMQNGDALASRFSAGDVAAAPPRPAVAQPAVQVVVESPAPAPAAPIPAVADASASGAVQLPATLQPTAAEPTPTPIAAPASPAPAAEPEAEAEMVATMSGPAMPTAPTIKVPEIAPIVASVLLPGPFQAIPRRIPPTLPTPAAAMSDDTVDLDSALAGTNEEPMVAGTDAEPLTAMGCDPVLSSAGEVATIVTLSLEAPCHANTPVTIHHQGMMFSAMTGADGTVDVEVPALAEVAVFIAAFDDGQGAVTTLSVPDFAEYDRAVLQWRGDASVNLSAYEFGAGFGETGHIWAGSMADETRAMSGEGGFLMKLGDDQVDDAFHAEVYVFPTAMMQRDGEVMLVAEAEITDANCEQELEAQSIQVGPDGASNALDLIMVMPGCDAVGDYLILQNMFEDLTLAAR